MQKLNIHSILIIYWCLTWSGRFTDEGDKVVLDLGESVIVVYHKHMSLAGLAADKSQLCHVHISYSNDKHTVACGGKTHAHKNNKDQLLSFQYPQAVSSLKGLGKSAIHFGSDEANRSYQQIGMIRNRSVRYSMHCT